MTQVHEFQKIVPIEVDIDKLRTIFNQVVIEFNPKENERTIGGLYTPSISNVDTVAEHAVRKGIVVKVPEYLYFNPKDISNSMRWKTDMELKIGDEVWINLSTINDMQYRCNGKYYKTILYEDVVVAKRKKAIIMLNGYLLLEPQYETKKFMSFTKEVIDMRFGTVAYSGIPNKRYTAPEYVQLGKTVYRSDPKGLKTGHKVMFGKKHIRKLRFLEYDPYSKLDGKKYLVAQRYMIAGIVEDGKEKSR